MKDSVLKSTSGISARELPGGIPEANHWLAEARTCRGRQVTTFISRGRAKKQKGLDWSNPFNPCSAADAIYNAPDLIYNGRKYLANLLPLSAPAELQRPGDSLAMPGTTRWVVLRTEQG
jgi:hypothetical protein